MGDLSKLHYRYVATWEIWGNSTTGMSRHGRSEETPLQVCRDMGDLRKLHYRYVATWEIWGNSTTGMSRHGRSEETPLQVTCQWPYIMTNYLYRPMKMEAMNIEKFEIKLFSLLRIFMLVEKGAYRVFIQYSWGRVTYMWPVMWFLQIFHATYQSRGASEIFDFYQIAFTITLRSPFCQHYICSLLNIISLLKSSMQIMTY
jgi:hypothetical protein